MAGINPCPYPIPAGTVYPWVYPITHGKKGYSISLRQLDGGCHREGPASEQGVAGAGRATSMGATGGGRDANMRRDIGVEGCVGVGDYLIIGSPLVQAAAG
ncbi:hypothetical protein GUJ93_ZPchr0001g31771 [Zizania palustris]|uniref:Uncharacterized protein n=1 Tax=Zizania palustris TaxID=103762 RepID=A0A8J5S9I6_ZIZPA|nr:hypothetical protein GUJ93_ZPchr0001g31771 [Zizania palustris]